METFMKRLTGMEGPEHALAAASFSPRPTDTYIVTYPKCGTTWVSFIAHCLRSRGHTDFEEICQMVPWTKFAGDCGIDINAEQVGNPRLYKSHESFDLIPKNAKYIYVARDPRDACVSFYHFALNWVHMSPDEVSLSDFVDVMFAARGSNSGRIWNHFLSYYEQRNDDSVLWMFYEDLIENRERCIEAIADFMGISLDDELREIVMHQSSFAFMKEHSFQFDEHIVFNSCKVNMGLSADAQVRAEKVNKGKTGEHKTELSDAICEVLDTQWRKIITAETGVQSYNDLRRELSVVLNHL